MTGCLSTLRAIALAALLIFAALLVRRRWASRYVTLEQVEKLETSLTAVLDESLAAARSASDKLRAENAALRARLGEPPPRRERAARRERVLAERAAAAAAPRPPLTAPTTASNGATCATATRSAQTPVEWRNKHGRFMHRGLLLRPGGLSLCKRGRAEVEGALINVAASVTELAGLGLRVRLDGGGEVELKLASDADRRRVADAIRASAAAPPTAGGVPAALPAAAPAAPSSTAAVVPTDAEAAEAMRASTARCHAAAHVLLGAHRARP